MHRSLEIFIRHLQVVVWNVFLLWQVYAVMFIIVCLYLSIKKNKELWGRIMFLLIVCLNLSVYVVIIKFTGRIYEDSVKGLDYWQKREGTNGLLYNKILRSLRAIRLEVGPLNGSFFYCDRELLISGLKYIFETVIDLLLRRPYIKYSFVLKYGKSIVVPRQNLIVHKAY